MARAEFPRFNEVLQAEAQASRVPGRKASTAELLERIAREVGREPETVRRWQKTPSPIGRKEAMGVARAISAAKAERLGASDPMAYKWAIYHDMQAPNTPTCLARAPEVVRCVSKIFEAGPIRGSSEHQRILIEALIGALCRVRVGLEAVAPEDELLPEISALMALAEAEDEQGLGEARAMIDRINRNA